MADYDIRRELLEGLEYQRASVRSIVGGLSEEAWHTPVVPSGWTVAGMVEHLGNAERHWFQEVVAALVPGGGRGGVSRPAVGRGPTGVSPDDGVHLRSPSRTQAIAASV